MAGTDSGDHSADADEIDDCAECHHLRLEGPDPIEYEVAPADGSGWDHWGAAFVRLLRRIGNDPTQAVIVTQDSVTQRYCQALVGHGLAHAEASSNVYLLDDARLSPAEEDALRTLGWQPPHSDVDVPGQMPANWTLPLIHGDWQYLAEIFVTTLAGIFGFQADVPVEIRCFQADHPCKACSWDDADDTPEAA